MERKNNFRKYRLCIGNSYCCYTKECFKMMIDLDIKAFYVGNLLCFKHTGWIINLDTMKVKCASEDEINELMTQPYKEIKIPYDYVFMLNHHRDNMVVVERVIKEMKMVTDQHCLDQ